MHPWTFADPVERSVLLGLQRLIGDTAVHGIGTARINKNGNCWDVSTKLRVRKAAARLAFCLFKHYQEGPVAIPETVKAWEEVCRSDDEFAKIRNQWAGSVST